LSKAYVEFLKYANNDSGLGIVLTPPHITELFCDLANVTKDSVILDNCCGTGGFLVAGLERMVSLAKDDKNKIDNIKKNQLLGIEYQDHIFTLCCSNMIIHGDGKTNIIKGDCFKVIDEAKKSKPTVGFLNPPYSQDQSELEFIMNNLEAIEKNGYCVAIVPMSSALHQKGLGLVQKEKLLSEHTLEAVVSMPDDLFYPVGTVTCIMVFKAHQPHPVGYKTYFGYWKDDGFEKRKNIGRVDTHNWKELKQKWIDSYRNRESEIGFSVLKEVRANDEWCAEAYMETDYSKLSKDDFEKSIRDYIGFLASNNLN
jgi:type I restriction enzyme M protein